MAVTASASVTAAAAVLLLLLSASAPVSADSASAFTVRRSVYYVLPSPFSSNVDFVSLYTSLLPDAPPNNELPLQRCSTHGLFKTDFFFDTRQADAANNNYMAFHVRYSNGTDVYDNQDCQAFNNYIPAIPSEDSYVTIFANGTCATDSSHKFSSTVSTDPNFLETVFPSLATDGDALCEYKASLPPLQPGFASLHYYIPDTPSATDIGLVIAFAPFGRVQMRSCATKGLFQLDYATDFASGASNWISFQQIHNQSSGSSFYDNKGCVPYSNYDVISPCFSTHSLLFANATCSSGVRNSVTLDTYDSIAPIFANINETGCRVQELLDSLKPTPSSSPEARSVIYETVSTSFVEYTLTAVPPNPTPSSIFSGCLLPSVTPTATPSVTPSITPSPSVTPSAPPSPSVSPSMTGTSNRSNSANQIRILDIASMALACICLVMVNLL